MEICWHRRNLQYGYQEEVAAGYRMGNKESDANWIIYRYPDILLMKAEALVQMGEFCTGDRPDQHGENQSPGGTCYRNYQ